MFRAVKNEENTYTKIPNTILRDKSLSFRARGVLAMALSNEDTWQVHNSWLVENGSEGRQAIKSAMRELEAAGYAVYSQSNENGVFGAGIWSFHEKPVPMSERSNPSKRRGGTPRADLPRAANPLHGYAAPKNNYKKEELTEEEPKAKEAKEAKETPDGARRFNSLEKTKNAAFRKDSGDSRKPPQFPIPTRSEFDAHVHNAALFGIEDFRPDLYDSWEEKGWRVLNPETGQLEPIRNWRRFFLGLNTTIMENYEKAQERWGVEKVEAERGGLVCISDDEDIF